MLVIHVVLTDGRRLILDMPVIGLVVDTSAMNTLLADNPARGEAPEAIPALALPQAGSIGWRRIVRSLSGADLRGSPR